MYNLERNMETVIKCEKIKEWNNKPIYGIHLSDGRGGESFMEIPIGTPVSDLQIIDNPNPAYAAKIRWNKPGSSNGFAGGGKQRYSGNESFALSYAKDIVVAGKVDVKHILPLADKLYDWLEKKKALGAPASNPVVLASQGKSSVLDSGAFVVGF